MAPAHCALSRRPSLRARAVSEDLGLATEVGRGPVLNSGLVTGRSWASSSGVRISATARRVVLALVGGTLVCCAVYLWQLPWTSEAVVIGPVWTPHFAIGAAIIGVTSLAACLIWALNALWRRYQSLSWSFELATLAVTGVVLVWLVSVGLACVGFIPADAHFAETQSGGRIIVTRTTLELKGTSMTEGVRSGLFVRWGASSFKRR